jgi:hypothetical protein
VLFKDELLMPPGTEVAGDRAGTQPGDTDVMFELDEILAQDDLRFQEISSAVTDAKAYAEALRIREDEAKKFLGLSVG